MIKGKAFLISAIVFGGLGLIVLVLTVISFFCGDNLISSAIATALGLDKESFTDATMGQIAVVFCIPTFIFAFRSLYETEEEPDEEIEAQETSEAV